MKSPIFRVSAWARLEHQGHSQVVGCSFLKRVFKVTDV